jgi:hypothetical protein
MIAKSLQEKPHVISVKPERHGALKYNNYFSLLQIQLYL